LAPLVSAPMTVAPEMAEGASTRRVVSVSTPASYSIRRILPRVRRRSSRDIGRRDVSRDIFNKEDAIWMEAYRQRDKQRQQRWLSDYKKTYGLLEKNTQPRVSISTPESRLVDRFGIE